MEKFLSLFADAIEREEGVNITDEFRGYPEWGSLAYLSVIAMIDEEYDVRIKGEDIRSAHTIQDLYNVVRTKE